MQNRDALRASLGGCSVFAQRPIPPLLPNESIRMGSAIYP